MEGKMKTALKYIIPLVLIPITVILGACIFSEKSYSFVSMAVAIFSCLLFYFAYERKGKTRRLIIVSVMTAIAVIGRFIFAPIPAFKPVTAIVVLTAVYLGSSAGFLTGSFSALISNFYFGQGPWTPFQMLAWGIIGFLAGILRNKLKNRITLSLYGVFAGVLYSVILELWNVLWYSNSFDLNLYLAFLLSSLPHTAIYAVSNVIFLMVMYKPIGSKLKRAEQRIFA